MALEVLSASRRTLDDYDKVIYVDYISKSKARRWLAFFALCLFAVFMLSADANSQTRRSVSTEVFASGSTMEGLRFGLRLPLGKTFGFEAGVASFFSAVSGSAGITLHLAPGGDIDGGLIPSPFSDISLLGHYYIGASRVRYAASLTTGILNTRTFGAHFFLRAGAAVFSNSPFGDFHILPTFEAGAAYSL